MKEKKVLFNGSSFLSRSLPRLACYEEKKCISIFKNAHWTQNWNETSRENTRFLWLPFLFIFLPRKKNRTCLNRNGCLGGLVLLVIKTKKKKRKKMFSRKAIRTSGCFDISASCTMHFRRRRRNLFHFLFVSQFITTMVGILVFEPWVIIIFFFTRNLFSIQSHRHKLKRKITRKDWCASV